MKRIRLFIILLLCLSMLTVGCNDSGITDGITDAISESLNKDTVTDTEDDIFDTEDDTFDTEDDSHTEEPDSDVTNGPNPWKYKTESGINIREVIINTDKGGEDVTVVQLTDTHYWAFTEKDLENPVLASTKENRTWKSIYNGASVAKAEKILAYADGVADQIMVTGDVIDFLSEGTLNLVQTTIWDKYGKASGKDKIMCNIGNHESVRQMQGKVADTTTLESRLEILQDAWEHNIYYTSKVLKDKVMVIQLENGIKDMFWDVQVDYFKGDLALAREKGYTVLLFYHIPISTGNAKYYNTKALKVGDQNNATANFYSEGINQYSPGASGEIYNLIINNGDIIKGCFCGHKHCDFYVEIDAKTADGKNTVIPQYVLIHAASGLYATKIVVK